MPVEVNFVRQGEGIEFISSGIVTGEQVIAANNRIYTSDILKRLKFKLVDRTDCTDYRLTADEIRIIASQDEVAAKINDNIIIALISTTDLQFGYSRMWQVYVDGTGFLTEIFPDRASAEAWLAEKLR